MGHNLCIDIFGAPSPEEPPPGSRCTARLPSLCSEVNAGASRADRARSFPANRNCRFERKIRLAAESAVGRECRNSRE